MASTLTAARVSCDIPTRTLYRLSNFTTTEGMGGDRFEYVVLSLGRDGDTCAFPANEDGGILDLVGFGYGLGPSRWLMDSEMDDYIAECIAQHELDGGTGYKVYGEST